MKLSFLFGTRPEAIKLYPVWREAKLQGHSVQLIFTGQHEDLVMPLLSFLEMAPDLSLQVMTPKQTLSSLSSRILQGLDESRTAIQPDFMLTQGDTTSAFVGAYWSFCHRIPVAHVEAGLRTFDLAEPFPEEANRQLLARIAQVHFAPTEDAARNLRREGIAKSAIEMVGNTGIDSLLLTRKRLKGDPQQVAKLAQKFGDGSPLVLVTAHRRESFGSGFEGICDGLVALAQRRPDLKIVYPVHPNPHVRESVMRRLGKQTGIHLIEPLLYPEFVWMMDRASLIITDSGGVQEEAPSLRKAILVLRRKTERPEGVRAGFSKLVGCDAAKILKEALRALEGKQRVAGANPYGDGKASKRILRLLSSRLR